jgi:hypothetical protein
MSGRVGPVSSLFGIEAAAVTGTGSFSASVSAVPEPGTLILLGTGLAGAAGLGSDVGARSSFSSDFLT